MNRRSRIFLVGMSLVAAFGLFWNLGNRLLWGDEAVTALLGLNIVKYGVPKAIDEKNEITLVPNHGDLSPHKLYVWSPWLGEYCAAGSFALFGKSTWAARLPFAGLALASVWFLAVVANRLYHNRELTLTAIFLLVTCVPFYLLARQCRYYGILFFAQIWMIYGFDQIIRGRAGRGSLHIALALTMQFYANYIVIPGNAAGLILAGCLLVREHRQLLWALPAALFGGFLLSVPWVLYTPPGNQLTQSFNIGNIDDHLFYCLSEIHFHLMPIPILLIPLAVVVYRRLRSGGVTSEWLPSAPDLLLWSLLLGQVAVLSISVPMVFFRYLSPLIPVLMLLGASILTRTVRPIWMRCLLVLVLALSNGVAIGSGWFFRGSHQLEMTYLKFVQSITTDYTDRFEKVLDFLQNESNSDQTVFVANPEFPLIFYTDMRIIDARFHPEWPADLPDWFLPISVSSAHVPRTLALPEHLSEFYERITLTVPATPWGAIRPDPDTHHFFTVPDVEEVLIYRKRDTKPELVQ